MVDAELNAPFKLPEIIQPLNEGEHIRGQKWQSDVCTNAALLSWQMLQEAGAPQPIIPPVLQLTFTNQQNTHSHAISVKKKNEKQVVVFGTLLLIEHNHKKAQRLVVPFLLIFNFSSGSWSRTGCRITDVWSAKVLCLQFQCFASY